MVVDDTNNTSDQRERNETKIAGGSEGMLSKRGDVRESKPFDLSAGIIGDSIDLHQGHLNDQVEDPRKVNAIQGHRAVDPINQGQQLRVFDKGKGKKIAEHDGDTNIQQNSIRRNSQTTLQAGDKGNRKPTMAIGLDSNADQEMLNLNGPEDEGSIESFQQQVDGTGSMHERGQRMVLVAVEVKERKMERRPSDMGDQSMTYDSSGVHPSTPTTQKRIARGQPPPSPNKSGSTLANRAEMKQAGTIQKLSVIHGERQGLSGSGDFSAAALSPTEQLNGATTIGGSQPEIDEKRDAVLGKLSWRDEFASIKVMKKPKTPNHVPNATLGEDVTPHFQGSHNTSPITRMSVSMPIESSGTHLYHLMIRSHIKCYLSRFHTNRTMSC
jgi:hypothetical protein